MSIEYSFSYLIATFKIYLGDPIRWRNLSTRNIALTRTYHETDTAEKKDEEKDFHIYTDYRENAEICKVENPENLYTIILLYF